MLAGYLIFRFLYSSTLAEWNTLYLKNVMTIAGAWYLLRARKRHLELYSAIQFMTQFVSVEVNAIQDLSALVELFGVVCGGIDMASTIKTQTFGLG